jgi:hypothetical protein
MLMPSPTIATFEEAAGAGEVLTLGAGRAAAASSSRGGVCRVPLFLSNIAMVLVLLS